MDDRFRIRPAEPADAVAIWAVERAAFTDPWTRSGIREMLETPGCGTLVAEDGSAEELAGYVMARVSGAEGEILNLAVLPGRRRRGCGGALLDAGLAWLRDRGAREVYLEVRESNAAAIALYQARRFQAVGTRPDYYRNPRESALVLRCPLLPGRQ